MVLWSLYLLGCVPAEETPTDAPHDSPVDTDEADTDEGSDTDETGESPGLTLIEGDPITTIAAERDTRYEFVEAAALGEGYFAVAGQGGYVVVNADLSEGKAVNAQRIYRIGWDPERRTAWMATRTEGIFPVDFSDPLNPKSGGTERPLSNGYHEDISFNGGRILLAALDQGALILDDDGRTRIGTISGKNVKGAALRGDRAVITDGDQLQLWDLTNLSAPALLSSLTLEGDGRDVNWVGDRVAVALGSAGVEVIALSDDTFGEVWSFEAPGAVYSTSWDGEDLWVAAWDQVMVVDFAQPTPVVVGHEPATEFVSGIAAAEGQAVGADWFYITTYGRVAGVGGAEVDVDGTLWFPRDDTEANAATFRNMGVFDLTLSFGSINPVSYTVSPTTLTLSPGESGAVIVTPTGPARANATLAWTSNDPDETSGELDIQVAQESLGNPHPDFELLGFTWPSTDLAYYTLDDFAGRTLVLAYFAVY